MLLRRILFLGSLCNPSGSDIKYNFIDRITKIYSSCFQKGKEKKKEIKIKKELTWTMFLLFLGSLCNSTRSWIAYKM